MYIEGVDERMSKVLKALDEAKELTEEHRTAIWNRAYEAVAKALSDMSPFVEQKPNKLKSAMIDCGLIN